MGNIRENIRENVTYIEYITVLVPTCGCHFLATPLYCFVMETFVENVHQKDRNMIEI